MRAGVKTAYMWYSAGARTLEDVLAGKGGIKLTLQQEIGIRYYDGKSAFPPRGQAKHELTRILLASSPCRLASADVRLPLLAADINERMPRSEATAIFEQIKRIGRCFLISISSADTIVTLVYSGTPTRVPGAFLFRHTIWMYSISRNRG